MDGLPLHPAIVHFPIALSLVVPLLGAVLLYALRSEDLLTSRALRIPAGFQLLALGLTFFAQRTGDEEHHEVESVVDRALIHAHEEAGEAFFIAVGVASLLWFAAAVAKSGALGRKAGWVAVVAGLVSFGLALRAGQLGGEMVYLHGAASAWLP